MKEHDIRPKELTEQLKSYLQKDKKLWLSGKKDFIRVPCPACESLETKDPIIVREMTFETCAECETVFYNPRPTREQLIHYYANAESYTFWATHIFPQTETTRRENIVRPLADKLLGIINSTHAITNIFLEIGAGFGIFSEEIKKSNVFQRVISIEPTPELAQKCRIKRLEVIESPFEKASFDPESIDCIVAFEVIEHLFSPKEFLRKIYSHLTTNGLLMLTCPNIKGFDFITLGKEKAPNFGMEHMNMFHPESMTLFLQNNGFEIVDITTLGRLDADIVRNQILEGNFSVENQPFLKRVLIDEWERLGKSFQSFLSDNLLSSNMMVTATKRSTL